MIVVAGGSILGIAALALVLIRRRKSPTVSKEAEPLIDEQPKDVPPIQKKTGPTNVAAPSSGPKKRGPPPAKAPPVVEEQSPAEQAAAQFAALDALTPTKQVERVGSWEDLPAGGEYEYTTEGTFYAGEECGRWILLDDGRFEKLEESM